MPDRSGGKARGDRAELPFQRCALAYAEDWIGLTEVGQDNAGPFVEALHRLAGYPSHARGAWCMMMLNAAAELAGMIRNELSPLEEVRRQGYVQDFVDWAGDDRIVPWPDVQPGDIFVIWFPNLGRFGHAGFVREVDRESTRFVTVEGNSNDDGSREGWEVVSKPRDVGSRIRFYRWAR